MKQILVKYEDNWADEVDIYGFRLFDLKEWMAYKDDLVKHIAENGELKYSFGTNEEITYDSVEDVLRQFTVNEISMEEYDAIVSAFNFGMRRKFGDFPSA
jgi:hypothetical protein